MEDDKVGLDKSCDDEILVSNVLLCTSQHTNKPLPVILSGVKDLIDKHKESSDRCQKGKRHHVINIREKLLNEYSNNHVLLSGAFPTLFPLGLTAESIGGGGPLKKKWYES